MRDAVAAARQRAVAAVSTTTRGSRHVIGRAVRVLASVPWLRVAFAAALVAYAALLWVRVGAYAGGADQSGYLNSARLLANGQFRVAARIVDALPEGSVPGYLYAPLGFTTADGGSIVPTYPVGLPLLVAAVAPVTGWDAAADVTMVVHALAGVLLTFWLARACGLSPGLAGLAGLLLATSPLYLFMSLTLMSDTPAMVWVCAAILLAWRSGQHAAWAVAAGAAASMAVLVRPTNVLVFLPLAVCLGTSSRRWLLLAMGGVPGAVLLLGYNAAVYGTPVATGYSDHAELFAWAHVLPSFRNYAAWLPIVLTPIGALSAALPALRHRAPRETTTLIVWAAAFLTLYAFYLYTQSTWWYLRFVLPAFPALIVAALLVARDVVLPRLAVSAPSWIARGASATAWPALLTAAILAHNGWWAERLVALEAGRGERKYYDVAQLTRSRLPPNAVVFAMQGSGALFYYTDFPVLRWDYLAPETLRRLQAEALAGGRPIYAVIFPFDMELNAFKDHLHGRWARIASVDDVTIWEFSGLDAPVRQTAGTPLD